MSKFPHRVVLDVRPKEYLKQGISHCGAYSVKAILSSYGLDKTRHPKEYHPGRFGRFTGITMNRQYWPAVFGTHGLKATPKSVSNLVDEAKLNVLKQLLTKGNPVMVSVGNGYLPSGRYSYVMGKIVGHWITLWGYDDKKEIFYVYDSAVPKERYDKKIPIGNTKRTYIEMLRDWKGALLSAVRGFSGYQYIEVEV